MKNLLKILLSLPIVSSVGSTISCGEQVAPVENQTPYSPFINNAPGSGSGSTTYAGNPTSSQALSFDQAVSLLQVPIDGSSLNLLNTLADAAALIQTKVGNLVVIGLIAPIPATPLSAGINVIDIVVHDVINTNLSQQLQAIVNNVRNDTSPNSIYNNPTTYNNPNPTNQPPTTNQDIDIDALVKTAYPYLESAHWWGDGAVTTDGIIAELQNKLGSSVVVKAVWSGFKVTRGMVAKLKVSVEQATNPTNKKEYDFHGRLKLVMIYETVAKDPGGSGSTTSHKGSWQSTVRIGTTTYGQILDYIKYSVFTEIVDFVDIQFKDNKNLSDTVKQYPDPGYSNRTEFMNFRVIDKTDPTNSTSFDIGFYDCL